MRKVIDFFKAVFDVLFGDESHSAYRYAMQEEVMRGSQD